MSRLEALEAAHRDGINFSWLVRLRWAAMAGQLVTIAVVHQAMGIALHLPPLLALIGLSFATNMAAFVWSARSETVPPWAIPALMVLDTLLLTGLLYLTGGPFNPFSFLYLVQIALAAVVLPARWTWTLVFLSLGCSAFLFLGSEDLPLPRMSHTDHMRIHLIGMWVAFGVAAGFIVYFLLRITRALAMRDAELYAARQVAARQEKLASLATLAAGTAHELATPLSTIALAARELDRELSEGSMLDAARSDAKLIREQVERCRAILDHMSVRGGEFAAESIMRVDLPAVVNDALSELAARPPIRVVLSETAHACKLDAPPKALALTLQNVLKNAQDASRDGQEVLLTAKLVESSVCIEVRDTGIGMAREVLDRIGEPFFTTKPPGSGMGLGVFVSRAMVERLGGRFSVTSAPAEGTCVTIVLPFDPATIRHIASPS
jgi:two-component system sensor histidine kinase RegB